VSILPAGHWAVVKAGELDGVELFLLLIVDPERANKPGYQWTEATKPLTGAQMRQELKARGHAEAAIDSLLERARTHEQPARQSGGASVRWIRDYLNGWIAEIEADAAAAAEDRWSVYAYPTDRSQQSIPAQPNVLGERQAKHLADPFVQEHAPHSCANCAEWRHHKTGEAAV
jgi:hypothetical protein